MNTSNKDIIKKVLSHIGRYRIFLICSIVLAAISVILTLYIPILTGQAVDCIVGAGAVDFAGIMAILKKMAVIIVITAAVQWLMNTCNNKIAYQVVRDVRDEAFRFDILTDIPTATLSAVSSPMSTSSRTVC